MTIEVLYLPLWTVYIIFIRKGPLMLEPELSGPFLLTPGSIEKLLDGVVSPGVILFGAFDLKGNWEAQATDRSDSHVRARLWANVADYPYFAFRLCSSPDEAYHFHCWLYHRYRPRYSHHPCPPEGKPLTCQICAQVLECEHVETNEEK